MTDKEQVIRKAERIMCSTVDRDMIDSFCEDVIAILKKQEPMKPIRDIDGIYHCGNCDQICVGYEVEFTHSIIKLENYCHKCGRSVKWE